MLAGMMGDMFHPEPANAMRPSVLPVINEIVEHEDDQEAPPGIGNGHHPIRPDQHHDPDRSDSG